MARALRLEFEGALYHVCASQTVITTVDGQTIIAQAYRLDNGVINVGRIVVKP
jgi:hypothetical protein